MKTWSFIDFGLQDFLRCSLGNVIYFKGSTQEEAEEWLLSEGEKYGWTNNGVRYWCWDEEG
jgi:hypothetical protein